MDVMCNKPDYENIKHLLNQECEYKLSDTTLDRLLSLAEETSLANKKILIHAGETAPDIYIVKEGIIRFVDMDGDKERTFAFGLPGTMFMSRHSFVKGIPSYFQVEACTPAVVLRIKKKLYWELVENCHEFALWVLHIAYEELFFQEYKNRIINGSAKERYSGLLKSRPEIIKYVPQKIIASYLGITPQYLSHLRRKPLPKESGI